MVQRPQISRGSSWITAIAQGTLVPYRTVLLEDGKQTQETRILNVTYGIKLDDALFKSPEA